MAWEELLEQQQTNSAVQPQPEPDAAWSRGSLLKQVCALLGPAAAADAARKNLDAPAERAVCADGYVRRSPVQPYRVAEDYHKRRVRKAVTVAVGICTAVLLVIALVRAGLVRF